MEQYVGPPYIRSDAARNTRLINFDTSYDPRGYTLKPQHKQELDKLLAFVSQTSDFSVWIVGYASKIGNTQANKTLSANRALAVQDYLKAHNPLFGNEYRLALFEFRGDQGYTAPRTDNSADERAVEVHIFIGDPIPPPPPPEIQPSKPKLPLPGGDRYVKWQVASPGGVFVAVVAGGGFNIFFVKNVKTTEIRAYIQPIGGAGASISLSGLGIAGRVIQNLLTGAQYSNPDFIDVTSPEPVTWAEVEGCLVRVTSASAGAVAGGGIAYITFASSGVYHYGPSGVPIQNSMELWKFQSSGKQWVLGVGASTVVGPLIRIDK